MSSRRKKSRPGLAPKSAAGSVSKNSSFSKQDLLAGGVLIALTIIAYLPVWHAGFIWDDDQHLTRNPCIIGPSGFADIWTSAQAYYYPLVLTTFWIIHQLAGLNPLPYHLLNVLLHAGSAVLLWRVLRKLGVPGAWLGAAVWALHPVMVQSVAWVTELKNTQSCFFYLLSILFFLKWDDNKKGSVLTLSMVFFAMAITSKTSTVMLPVVLGLLLWWRHQRVGLADLVRLMPFFLISAFASAWTIWEQKFHSGAQGVRFSESWLQRFAIAGYDVWFYLGKLVLPMRLSFFYPQWKIDAANFFTFLPLALALIGLGFLFWKRKGPLRPIFVAAAYFVVSTFPVLGFFNVFFFRYSYVSDHFQYLAAMGPLALISASISTGLRKFGQTKVMSGLAVVLLMVLGTATWLQASHYRDAQSIYRMAIQRNPQCWPAYTNLGAQFLQERRFDDAIEYCRNALTIKADVAETQYNLGNCYLAKQDFGQAIGPYRKALELQPRNPRTHSNLAACLASTGDIEGALTEWQKAIDVDPSYAEAHYNLGYVLGQLGRINDALPHLKEAIRLNPNHTAAKQQLQLLTLP